MRKPNLIEISSNNDLLYNYERPLQLNYSMNQHKRKHEYINSIVYS